MYIFDFNHKILTLPIAIYLRLIPHLGSSFIQYNLSACAHPTRIKKCIDIYYHKNFTKLKKRKKKSTYPEQAWQ